MVNNTLFISESPVYGGHEEMFLRFLAKMNENDNFSILINSRNSKFIDELNLLKRNSESDFNIITHSFLGLPVRPVTNFFSLRDGWEIWRIIRKYNFKRIVVIQGTIEIGGLSLLVGRMAGCKVISYIPLTRKSADLGVRFGRLRDGVNRWIYYRLPDLFITISDFNKHELVHDFAVVSDKVAVVHNFVDDIEAGECPLLPAGKNFLLIGRIDFLQKRQDSFLAAFVNNPPANVTIHIIGDNESSASQELRALFSGHNQIQFHGWKNNHEVHALMLAADGVILPSLFEGVPLVMIEAIKLKRIVFATNVDGMNEFLPQEWLFELDDFSSALNLMNDYQQNSQLTQKKINEVSVFFSQNFNCIKSCAEFYKLISE